MLTFVLAIVGACCGVIAWILFGFGMVELAGLAAFDPMRLSTTPVPVTITQSIVEWSGIAFAVAGAVVTPPIVRWLVRPSPAAEGR